MTVIQHGRRAIPTSTRWERIAESIDVFDFRRTESGSRRDPLDKGVRGGPGQDQPQLVAFQIPET